MKIHVAAGGVYDSKGKPYGSGFVPDPECFKTFRADQAVLNAANESRLGRDGKMKMPVLNKGIELKRGEQGVTLDGVDEDYLKMIRADKSLVVTIIETDSARSRRGE